MAAGCGRPSCRCTHTDPCDRGWIDLPPSEYHGVVTARVAPCPICRPEAAGVVEAPTPGKA